MKKQIQTTLIILAISFGTAARLSIMGWLFFVGIGTIIIFGITHLVIHFYSMNYLSVANRNTIFLIILSHLFFISLFLFQTDADDSRGYSVIGYIFDFKSKFLFEWSVELFIVGLVGYVVTNYQIIVKARRDRTNGNNLVYAFTSIFVSLFLPFVLINGLESYRREQETKSYEQSGEFHSITRALKKTDKVRIIKINPYETSLTEFPIEIIGLHNLIEIDLTDQMIKSIPDNIGTLKKLEILTLKGNKIDTINPAICDCINLRELRIGGDNIQTFPDCLKQMKSLKHLSVQSNTVNELMEELREFKNIETAHFYLKSGVLDKEKWKTITQETGIEHSY
ncbi:MAG: leucine-rich repeat domain-containing protein [Saprospiraceae bacterium]